MECHICQEYPILPVRWKCFPCSPIEPKEGSCNVFTIFCKVCSDRYFEFDKKNKFLVKKKCIYCPNEQYIDSLTPDKAYTMELLMMKMDDQIRQCPYQCGYENQHLDVYHHTLSDCKNRPTQCKECKQMFPFHDLETHPSQCPNYKKCLTCDQYILSKNFHNHKINDHKAVQCKYCSTYIINCLNEEMTERKLKNHWESRCKQHIFCDPCNKNILPKEANKHFQSHYFEIEKFINHYQKIENELMNTNMKDRARQLRWINRTLFDMRLKHTIILGKIYLNID